MTIHLTDQQAFVLACAFADTIESHRLHRQLGREGAGLADAMDASYREVQSTLRSITNPRERRVFLATLRAKARIARRARQQAFPQVSALAAS